MNAFISDFLSMASQNQVLTLLAVASFVLLIVVTGGVAYLTAIEWRDKRRRGDAERAMPARGVRGKRK